jgi:hypothetical protein
MCFDRDPAWQGWEAWYFGRDETFEAAVLPLPEEGGADTVAKALPEPALLH